MNRWSQGNIGVAIDVFNVEGKEMGRDQAFVGICLLALVVTGVACTAQALQGGSTEQAHRGGSTEQAHRGGSTEQFPAETAPFDAEKGARPPTVPVEMTKETDTVTGSEKSPTPKRGADTVPRLGTPDRRPLPERVPFSEETMTRGEVPEELLQDIINDLVARTGADPESIEVQRAEAVVWRDGSLGCPRPGMMYTQALVDGYWVVLGYDGEAYDYRANSGGYFALCEESLSLRSAPLDSGDGEAPTR
jgi:hypothetical protein